MKTNVSIELSDAQRCAIANVIDGKISKRQASRADIVALAQGAIDACIAIAGDGAAERVEPDPVTARQTKRPTWQTHPNLVKFSDQIEAGIKEQGFRTEQEVASYRRGWTLRSIRS